MKKFIVFLLLSSPLILFAIPAKQGVHTIVQADGTTLNVRVVGDEFFNYQTTEDGYLIKQKTDNLYYYADIGADGKIVASTMKAKNPSKRTAAESSYLSTKRKNYPSHLALSRATEMRRKMNPYLPRQLVLKHQEPSSRGLTAKKELVILINFADVNMQITKEEFSNMLNSADYNAPVKMVSPNSSLNLTYQGSAVDYFKDNSFNAFNTTFDVIGPVTLPESMAYYGANDIEGSDVKPREMIIDACKAAANITDLSAYKSTAPGRESFVDGIFVFFPGIGANEGNDNNIWPHRWSCEGMGGDKNNIGNGVLIGGYACASELSKYPSGNIGATGIGTFCHEYSHVLGLVDMYDTDYENNGYSIGLGNISLMASGCYKHHGLIPTGYTLFEKWNAGFIDQFKVITKPESSITIKPDDKFIYAIVNGENPNKFNEFFYLEARSGIVNDWDRMLVKEKDREHWGLAVYHVHYHNGSDNMNDPSNSFRSKKGNTLYVNKLWRYNEVNCYPEHECMMPIPNNPAQKAREEANQESSPASLFFFPTANITALTPYTKPPLTFWDGNSQFSINRITKNSDGSITLDILSVVNSKILVDGSYNLGTTIDAGFSQSDGLDLKENLTWYLNGTALPSNEITFNQKGENEVKVKASYTDGTKELMIKYVNIN